MIVSFWVWFGFDWLLFIGVAYIVVVCILLLCLFSLEVLMILDWVLFLIIWCCRCGFRLG